MQGVILAAGKGTRLRPVTNVRSKAMAPVAGQPMVQRVLDLLVENDVRDFVIVVGPDDREIRRYFASPPSDIRVRLVEQRERRGAAHALSLAAPHITGDFLLSACDNLVPSTHVADLLATHRDSRGGQQIAATLSLMTITLDQVSTTGIVDWDGDARRVRRIVEKPTPAAAPSTISSLPLYLFAYQFLEYLPRVQPSPRGEYELQEAMQMLIDDGAFVTGAFTGGRVQLTDVDDLLRLNRLFLKQAPAPALLEDCTIDPTAVIYPPVHIAPHVTVGAHALVGPNAVIERDVVVEAEARVTNAIVLRGARVERGRAVVNGVAVA